MSQFHNVFKCSADAMAAILTLHFPTGTILDVNFGLGVFYGKTKREVTGVDLRLPASVIADNKNLPFASDSFDIGVLDPPYKRGPRNQRYTARYGPAPVTEQRVTRSYIVAIPELLRVCRQGVIFKCQDGPDGHTFYSRHFELIAHMKQSTGLPVHDIAVSVRHAVPSAMVQGKRHFFQQTVSYFLIWKWRSKRPFRPVRF